MTTALAGGFLRSGILKVSDLFAFDVSEEAKQKFVAATGGTVPGTLKELAGTVEVLFLAVKPQHLGSVFAELGPILSDRKKRLLVVSIAAGITIATLAEGLGKKTPIIRVMPNTPCLIGSGASGFCPSEQVSEDEIGLVQSLLETVGIAVRVSEGQLNAITGLSGSGPAFGYMIVEALSDGGVQMGLSRDVATRLAAQTLKGAAEMVLQTGEHPAVLKDRVASPGGTTIAGIAALEQAGLRSALIAAVLAATERSFELSRPASPKADGK